MKTRLTFDDVLLEPQFSEIKSRKDVDLWQQFGLFWNLKLPIISANMSSVTGVQMANVLADHGAIGALHRFCTIDENVKMYKQSHERVIVSFGLGSEERHRVIALRLAGAQAFCLDVAHGANQEVVEQVNWFGKLYPDATLIVGNFASLSSVKQFLYRCGRYFPDYIKVGIGPGSSCTTRIKTGHGYPQLSAIYNISNYLKNESSHVKVIADGGINHVGDIAKALAAGAHYVMLGKMLAGANESLAVESVAGITPKYKIYKGSASLESYKEQGKDADWRAAEGEVLRIPYTGSVKSTLQEIEGGLRSALSYSGAKNLNEFRAKAKFIKISPSTIKENGTRG